MNKDLEELLLEMQKTLETLEEAEVQKYADEREIESLRAAIRQLTRTRENRENHNRAPQGRQDSGRQDPRMRHSHRDQRFQSSQRNRGNPAPQDHAPEPAHSSEQPPAESAGHEEDIRPERPQEPEIPF